MTLWKSTGTTFSRHLILELVRYRYIISCLANINMSASFVGSNRLTTLVIYPCIAQRVLVRSTSCWSASSITPRCCWDKQTSGVSQRRRCHHVFPTKPHNLALFRLGTWWNLERDRFISFAFCLSVNDPGLDAFLGASSGLIKVKGRLYDVHVLELIHTSTSLKIRIMRSPFRFDLVRTRLPRWKSEVINFGPSITTSHRCR